MSDCAVLTIGRVFSVATARRERLYCMLRSIRGSSRGLGGRQDAPSQPWGRRFAVRFVFPLCSIPRS